jgi:hypothetical protein
MSMSPNWKNAVASVATVGLQTGERRFDVYFTSEHLELTGRLAMLIYRYGYRGYSGGIQKRYVQSGGREPSVATGGVLAYH